MAEIINYTPHDVVIRKETGEFVKSFSSAGVARISVTQEMGKPIEGIPIIKTTYGEIKDLPQKREGVYLIVSQIVKAALSERDDLLYPINIVKSDDGVIIGCSALGH